jgi:thiol-disulfide isomerase/thioredoxin
MMPISFLFACLANLASTQEQARVNVEPTLLVGSKAPAISVETWIKGNPVWSLEPGRVYVVEFWATWCPPCTKAIPHLSDVQNRHRNASVVVIGVASHERGSDQSQKLAGLQDFVAARGEKMSYTVGFDPDRSMQRNWMEPARQTGIPTAFVVDRKGIIAWIGHPRDIDTPLAQILANTWDLKAAAARFLHGVETEAKGGPLLSDLSAATKAEEWSKAVTVIETLIALDPDQFAYLSGDKFRLLLTKLRDTERAYAYAREVVAASADRAEVLNSIAWAIVDPESKVEKRDLELAMSAAERANLLAHDTEASYLDTLARVYATQGNFAKAAALQQKAVELLVGDEQKLYEQTLIKYKAKLGG